MEAAGIEPASVAGFEAVREKFEQDFAKRGEVGASSTVVRDGEPVIDLWGKLADKEA